MQHKPTSQKAGQKQSQASYQQALEQIAQIATSVAGMPAEAGAGGDGSGPGKSRTPVTRGCSVKVLPTRLHKKAALAAIKVNPVNAPLRMPMGRSIGIAKPLRLTLDTGRYWGPTARTLSVSFTEDPSSDLRSRIVSHLNAWTATGCISFAETSGTGDVRISLGPGGYYSYLGTDILLIPEAYQTMNLEGFSMEHPESEFRRVVRHEAGHTLGFPHEHMRAELVNRIDPQKAYDYFWQTQGWDMQTVDEQVLTSLDEETIFGTAPDEDSIMCYQLPGEITYGGDPIRGGEDINATDYDFVSRIYPKGSFAPPEARGSAVDDWAESEDVLLPV